MMPHIRCPGCKTRYKVPAVASGKRTKCKQCGRIFRVPQFKEKQQDELEPYRLTDLDALSGGEAIEIEQPRAVAPHPVLGSAPAEAIPAEQTVAYAAGAVREAGESAPPGGGYAGYFRSFAQSFAFPARVGNLITFLIVWVILIVGDFVGAFACCLGLVGYIIVQGWYISFQLNTVVGAAAGEEDLPTLALTGGVWEDIVGPFLKMFCTYVAACLPALVFFVAAVISVGASPVGGGAGSVTTLLGTQSMVIGIVLLAAGFFVWPILVLAVSCGSFGAFLRPDLIIMTIFKSFPAYVIVVAAVYVSAGLSVASAVFVQPSAGGGFAQFNLVDVIVFPAIVSLLELYFTIISMRAIGLYYHNFKHRFAWSWG